MEMLRKPPTELTELAGVPGVPGVPVPAVRTVVRILHRQGLSRPRPRKRPRSSYVRWQRPAPMQLWQVDIVAGIAMVDPRTGELWQAKVVTGVDDHSRFCVLAKVVARATSRAVCRVRRGAGAVRGARGNHHGQRQTVHRSVRPARDWQWGGVVRQDLPS